MSDRTKENKTRVYVNGVRTRVGNPAHPYHTLYKESGIDAVYDTMFKVDVEPRQAYDGTEGYQHEPWLTLLAVVVSMSLFVGGVLALGGPF
jgi:hypothetical protein